MQPALLVAIAWPSRGEREVDPLADRGPHVRAAAACAMRREPPVEIVGVAEIVARVMVGALKVQQVDDAHNGPPDLGSRTSAGPFLHPPRHARQGVRWSTGRKTGPAAGLRLVVDRRADVPVHTR